MDGIKKALGNAPVFVIAYIVFMLPTYFLPYLGSNSSVVGGIKAVAEAQGHAAASSWPFWVHIASLVALCFFCLIRGSYVKRGWLILFPFLAMAFDFLPGLSLIPMLPTLMHILAMIFGVVGAKAVLEAKI